MTLQYLFSQSLNTPMNTQRRKFRQLQLLAHFTN